MMYSETMREYLNKRGVSYRLVPKPPACLRLHDSVAGDIPPNRRVRAVLLQDRHGPLLAILPCSHLLDLVDLSQLLNRSLEVAPGEPAGNDFADCPPDTTPLLPDALDLPAIAEIDLAASGELYFDPGSNDSLVCMANDDFRMLLTNADWMHFSKSVDSLVAPRQEGSQSVDPIEELSRYSPTRLKGGVESIKELPALPLTAHQIVELNMNQRARPRDLARIVERDASLAAQIIRWARSPYYSYRGRVDCVEQAISRVLGFDMVMNLTLGIALGRPFRMTVAGPVGLSAFWRHSIYCATTVSELVKALPEKTSLKPGMAYLAGLLHNFGYLLLGHKFPGQHDLLNRFLAVNSHLPPSLVERYVLGAEHPHIGAWLMQSWQMPDELLAAVRWHHEEDTGRAHAHYPNLVLIANRLLIRRGIGDERCDHLPPSIMSSLGLTRIEAERVLAKIAENSEELDDLSRQLSA